MNQRDKDNGTPTDSGPLPLVVAKKTRWGPSALPAVVVIVLGLLIGSYILYDPTEFFRGVYRPKDGTNTVRSGGQWNKVVFPDGKSGEHAVHIAQGYNDSFPKDLPVYEYASVTGYVSGSNGQQDYHRLVLFAQDHMDQIVSFYDTELRSTGWQISQHQISTTAFPEERWNIKKKGMSGTIAFRERIDVPGTTIAITVERSGNTAQYD